MDLAKELAIMQENYAKNPLRFIRLDRPDWLQDWDRLTLIYRYKDALLDRGTVALAYVVQANVNMFHFFPRLDCPANIIYSASPAAIEHPQFLQFLAYQLSSYKNRPPEQVPEAFREIAYVITDEYSRGAFTFEAETGAGKAQVRFIPTILYRKLLPLGKLCGGYLPVLTIPETRTAIILPKQYWTWKFKIAWCLGRI